MKKFGTFKVAALVLTLVLALTLVGVGGAFAAGSFKVHETTVSATISEAFTVSYDNGQGTWVPSGSTYPWTVNAYPGETKTLNLKIDNAGSADLGAYVAESSGVIGGVGYYTVLAGGSVVVPLTWTIAADATPGGPYTLYVTIKR